MHIRGYNVQVNVDKEAEPIETLMWNPLHFAVFKGHLEVTRFLVEETGCNLAVTAPKSNPESEIDPTNSANFPEDKIFLLLTALEKKHFDVLSYLLNRLPCFWSRSSLTLLFEKAQEMDSDEAFELLYSSKLS